jgi:hypothetical protein
LLAAFRLPDAVARIHDLGDDVVIQSNVVLGRNPLVERNNDSKPWIFVSVIVAVEGCQPNMWKQLGYLFGLQIALFKIHPQMAHCDYVVQSALRLSLGLWMIGVKDRRGNEHIGVFALHCSPVQWIF